MFERLLALASKVSQGALVLPATGAGFEESDEPDFITVSAVVAIGGQAVLYTGILEDFFLDHDGMLDRFILQNVMRRPFLMDKAPGDPGAPFSARFYPVDGDYFVLRYSEGITVNVEYVKLAPDGQTDEVAVATPAVARSQPAS